MSELNELEALIAPQVASAVKNYGGGPNVIVPISDPMFVTAFGPVCTWESSEATKAAVAAMGERIAKATGLEGVTVQIIPHSDVERLLSAL